MQSSIAHDDGHNDPRKMQLWEGKTTAIDCTARASGWRSEQRQGGDGVWWEREEEGGGEGGGVTDTLVFDSSGGHHPRGKQR